MKKNKRHLKNGFTLIEILISFGIFAILLAIVLSGFMDTRKLERLKQSSAELVSALQKAQNFALTGYASSGSVPPSGGYGVHLDKNSTEYFIFADTNSVMTGPACDTTKVNQRYDIECSEQKVGGSNFLQSGVIIHKILVGSPAVQASVIDIAFKSPLRMPYVGTGASAGDRAPGLASSRSVEIYLKWNDKNVCRKVSVKGTTGQISEQAIDWTTCNAP